MARSVSPMARSNQQYWSPSERGRLILVSSNHTTAFQSSMDQWRWSEGLLESSAAVTGTQERLDVRRTVFAQTGDSLDLVEKPSRLYGDPAQPSSQLSSAGSCRLSCQMEPTSQSKTWDAKKLTVEQKTMQRGVPREK